MPIDHLTSAEVPEPLSLAQVNRVLALLRINARLVRATRPANDQAEAATGDITVIGCDPGEAGLMAGLALLRLRIATADAAPCGPTTSSRLQRAAMRLDSTADARTVNNVMRHEYRVLGADEKLLMREIKDLGLSFVTLCDSIGASRELSVAKTKAEEAVMWAVKHVTA